MKKPAQKFVKVVNDYLIGFRENREESRLHLSNTGTDSLAGQLTSLKQLLDSGALTKKEFELAKNRLLGNNGKPDHNDTEPLANKDGSDNNNNNSDFGGRGIGL